jgi:UMF1 family MFS transporter
MNQPWLKRALPWALYDWANSAFALTLMAAFVPVFNKDFWSAGAELGVATFRLGVASSAAAVVVALLAPALGAIADRGGARKKFLAFFAATGVAMTASLSLVGRGQWGVALALYALACVGFSGANVFYDSLMVSVAEEDKFDVVSALGYSLGYIGGALLFAFNIWTVVQPERFGLPDKTAAIRGAFLSVAVWWTVFSLPLLFHVREEAPARLKAGLGATVAAGFRQLRGTFGEIRQLRAVWLFLVAYWLYIDGVDTVVQMAVAYGGELGLPAQSLMLALLVTQLVGFPAALLFGKLGERIGARGAILIGLAVYVGVCVLGFRMQRVREFYLLAVAVGLVQGGVQALSRSLYARLIPTDKAAEFFGFYNMLGKFAAILGPLLIGGVGLATGNPRLGILALIVLFVAGGALLLRVKTSGLRETRAGAIPASAEGSVSP